MSRITESSEPDTDLMPISPEPRKLSYGKLSLLIVVGVLLALVSGRTLLRLSRGLPIIGPPEFHGLVIQSPPPISNFTLAATTGENLSLRDFRGKIVLLYFGYRYCPDVCPATMVELKRMMAALGRDAKDVQVIMISVDPDRDTPEQLAAYVTQFHPSFIGMTGSEAELLGVTTQLGIYYQKHEGTPATGYLVDHTATVSVMDRNGRLRLVFPFETKGEEMAVDLRYLLHYD